MDRNCVLMPYFKSKFIVILSHFAHHSYIYLYFRLHFLDISLESASISARVENGCDRELMNTKRHKSASKYV